MSFQDGLFNLIRDRINPTYRNIFNGCTVVQYGNSLIVSVSNPKTFDLICDGWIWIIGGLGDLKQEFQSLADLSLTVVYSDRKPLKTAGVFTSAHAEKIALARGDNGR